MAKVKFEDRERALSALAEFDSEHAAVLAQREALLAAVQWPPPGHERCLGEDGKCPAVFPCGQMPADWVETQYSCGDGGSGEFLCPACFQLKVAELDGDEWEARNAGRCEYCAR